MPQSERTCRFLAVLVALAATACSAPRERSLGACDVLIHGGMVVDGSGAPARRADVAIQGERIVLVRELGDAELDRAELDPIAAKTRIDARGRVVAPGFIDVHAHGDALRAPGFESCLAMGVTTICLGLDGSSPWRGDAAREWFDAVERRRPGVNVAALVGHGSVRRLVLGDSDRRADESERARMAALVAAALDEGAFGLSTGLEYTPGRFADAAELAAVAAPVGARGGLVSSHLRSEDDGAVEAALGELLEQCAASGARAHWSHAKIVFAGDPQRAARLLDVLAGARARGVRATADVYPYAASYTGLSILFPDFALPPNDYASAVANERAALGSHLHARVLARNGPGAMLFGSGPYAGSTLAEAAAARGVPFEELLLELGPDGASAAYFVMAEPVVQRLLQDPHVMVASDGSPTMRHPRGHGTFAKILRETVREQRLLTLEEAVRKMTSLPADTLGLRDRGRVAPGAIADLVVFDPAQVTDHATWTEPFRRATGIDCVLVGGRFALRDGAIAETRAGSVLRRAQVASSLRASAQPGAGKP